MLSISQTNLRITWYLFTFLVFQNSDLGTHTLCMSMHSPTPGRSLGTCVSSQILDESRRQLWKQSSDRKDFAEAKVDMCLIMFSFPIFYPPDRTWSGGRARRFFHQSEAGSFSAELHGFLLAVHGTLVSQFPRKYNKAMCEGKRTCAHNPGVTHGFSDHRPSWHWQRTVYWERWFTVPCFAFSRATVKTYLLRA